MLKNESVDLGNIFSKGYPNYVTCITSPLKPFQAAAAIRSSFNRFLFNPLRYNNCVEGRQLYRSFMHCSKAPNLY